MRAPRLGFLVLSAALAGTLIGCSDRNRRRRPTPPDVPQNVAAISGCEEVLLTWDPVSRASAYNVFWATSPGVTPVSPAFPVMTGASFVHGPLTGGTTYYYRVSAVNSAGESSLSSEVSGTPAPVPVPALSPDSFTRVDSLTSRNPNLQTPFLSQTKDGMTATSLPLQCGLVVLIGGTSGGTALAETEGEV